MPLSRLRVERRSVPPPPSHAPSMWAHTGTTAAAKVKSSACNSATARVRPISLLHQLLRDHIKRAADFFHYHRELHRQYGLFRVDYHVNGRLQHCPPQPHRLAQPPLDSVALHGATQHAPDGKTDARTTLGLPQVEHGHVRGEEPLTLLVNAIEVGMPKQSRRAGKSGSFLSRRPLSILVGSQCAHQYITLHNTTQLSYRCSVPYFLATGYWPLATAWGGEHYSRKPGFTETRLRPLARRRDST